MEKWTLNIAVVLLGGCVLMWAAGQGGPNESRKYDLSTVTTVHGTVQEVTQHPGRRGGTGIHLLVKTETGPIEVHVGPASYVTKQQFAFSAGESVEVTGSRVKIGGTDTILAREVRKDGKTLVLRNAQGIPNWRGGPDR